MELPTFRDTRHAHAFTRTASGSQPTRATRSWVSNGVHYTIDTATFSSPGFSFGAVTGSADAPFRNIGTIHRPSTRPAGFFGGAFGLLDDLLSVQTPQRQDPRSDHVGQTSSNSRRGIAADLSDTDDDDLVYENDEEERSNSRSVFSRLKDKLLDVKQRPQPPNEYGHSRTREHSLNRDRSPARRPRGDRRHSSYRRGSRGAEWTELDESRRESVEVDYEDLLAHVDPRMWERRTSTASLSEPPDMHTVEGLREAAETERRAVRSCRKRLENASRQPATSSHHLQHLLDELKAHETAWHRAQTNLDRATARRNRDGAQSTYQARRAHQAPPRQPMRATEDDFTDPFAGLGGPFFQQSRSRNPDPIFRAFENFGTFSPFGSAGFDFNHPVFEHGNTPRSHFPGYSATGGVGDSAPYTERTKRTRYSVPSSGPQPRPQHPVFTTFPAPPARKQPPANLLQPSEAKSLFGIYNERWNAMSNTDGNVPYPARGLQAESLLARDSIWAPLCQAEISAWSDEAVMQANAQAFFLGVVGLGPVYREAPGTGSIEMGFEKSKATSPQVEELVSILKKEKTRWHSDRLGRRNGGTGVPNEALQKDERARAVFHAVCGLMESAQ